MPTTLNLRSTIESSFLPVRCRCTVATDQSLTVQLFDRYQRVDLEVTGIRVDQLDSSRAISSLVSRLRCELLDKQSVVPLRNAG